MRRSGDGLRLPSPKFTLRMGRGSNKAKGSEQPSGDYDKWQHVKEMMEAGDTILEFAPMRATDSDDFLGAITSYASDFGGLKNPHGLAELLGTHRMPNDRSKVRVGISADFAKEIGPRREIALLSGVACEFKVSARAGLRGKVLGYIQGMWV